MSARTAGRSAGNVLAPRQGAGSFSRLIWGMLEMAEAPDMKLEIAPEKVAHVIIKAREYDAKVGAWDSNSSESDSEDDPASILQDLKNDPTRSELVGFINALNDDEQAHLVALTWIGRGTFEPEDLDEAVETAKNERTGSTSAYLLGMPLLADYLEEGLEKLGFTVEDVESDIL